MGPVLPGHHDGYDGAPQSSIPNVVNAQDLPVGQEFHFLWPHCVIYNWQIAGVIYRSHAIEVRQTPVFTSWFKNLKDRQAQARIADRLVRLESGLFGDMEPVGEGVSELRLQFGPGYRVYFVQRG